MNKFYLASPSFYHSPLLSPGNLGTYYHWLYLTGAALVDRKLKKSINSECNWTAASLNIPKALSLACETLLGEASVEISHVNLYNIYGDCVSGGCPADSTGVRGYGKIPVAGSRIFPGVLCFSLLRSSSLFHLSIPTPTPPSILLKLFNEPQTGLKGPDACIDSHAASAYFNRPDVQKAIHVRTPGFCWSVCSSQVFFILAQKYFSIHSHACVCIIPSS